MDNTTVDLAMLFSQAARAMLRGHHHQGPLHPAQGRILSLINERGSIHRKELLELIEVRSGSLSELLGKLERHNYIIKTQDQEDKRGFMLSITEKGAALVAEYHDWKKHNTEDRFSVLSPEERQQLAGILVKLTAAWEERGHGGEGRQRGAHDVHGRHGQGRRHQHHARRGEGRGHQRAGHGGPQHFYNEE